jgi:outer membrane receptor protein involved in Fe transport
MMLLPRISLILGVRYQQVNSKTTETPGLDEDILYKCTDGTLVGSLNFIYNLTESINLVASAGRGFRSPNLIERFFDGPTPQGSGYQSRNLDLKAETSFNIDLGVRFRRKSLYAEIFYFNNTIYDGIRISPTGNKISGLPEYRNVNIEKIRLQGFEALGQVTFTLGLTLAANYTYITSDDLVNPDIPYINTYSSKFNLNLRYEHPRGFFWMDYNLRINGEQEDVGLVDNPIGTVIPGFTVHSVRFGVAFFKKRRFSQHLIITIGNLTNELYAEFSNASFFRPAPKRYFVVSWSTSF